MTKEFHAKMSGFEAAFRNVGGPELFRTVQMFAKQVLLYFAARISNKDSLLALIESCVWENESAFTFYTLKAKLCS